MKLYTLHISHRHGDDISVHATHDDAFAALAAYSREWWSREGLAGEPPTDDQDAVNQYWEHVEDETANIEGHEFTPAVTDGADDAYLSRFPTDHRATADRAYQDGFVDGVESARAEEESH